MTDPRGTLHCAVNVVRVRILGPGAWDTEPKHQHNLRNRGVQKLQETTHTSSQQKASIQLGLLTIVNLLRDFI